MARIRQIFSLLTLFILSFAAIQARAVNFGTGLTDTEWRIDASPYFCSFYQPIPQYGLAVFFHQAGETLEFYLQSTRNLMAEGQAAITIQAPEWRSSALTDELGYTTVKDRKIPIRIETARAGRMMDELGNGMSPTLTRKAKFGDDRISVSISPVNFKQYYNDYLACQTGLLPVNYGQIERTSLSFASGGDTLSAQVRSQLDDIVTYLKEDDLITAIYVDGHSDAQGNRYDNRRLSEKRAYRVTDYLVNSGIDAGMILTRYHGERYPIATNETAAGRAKNRRVTVQFDRINDDPNDPLLGLPDFEAQ
ncbi:flagellar protein MotY [Reinekea marinisedimentorum]|uniref:OmpA family protein n=1 Tax=Reinekea marinisedimentorum TaxID=230495 RepID=A0A4R3I7B1_9GAMM|nr:OmpA family protein [Reinekea marinisedimentorum]TCS41650.1 OmpA family protein [Reinekea marinisedimentorum]